MRVAIQAFVADAWTGRVRAKNCILTGLLAWSTVTYYEAQLYSNWPAPVSEGHSHLRPRQEGEI